VIRPAPRKYGPKNPALCQRAQRSLGGGAATTRRKGRSSILEAPSDSAPHLRDAAVRQREAHVLRAVRDYLTLLPGVVVIRQNTGMLPIEGRFVRFGIEGFPDLFGSVPWCYRLKTPQIRPDGAPCGACGPRPFAFEIKRPGGKRSPAQLAMAATLEAAGWLYACVESVEQVQAVLGR